MHELVYYGVIVRGGLTVYYDVMDVAAYIVGYSIEQEMPVSNLKLQKLLYYVQAYFLVHKGRACFREEIEHWRHGPVVRDVYYEYKVYFNDKITSQIEYNDEFDLNDRRCIEEVVDSYKNYGPWQMVDKTHNEEPWVNTDSDDIISNDELKDYYSKHEKKILGRNING